ncbi:3-hydroxyacyl-CoA dehydrogenase NAD-binding domain-containing protein [Vitreoscilla filiformis]|nr:3-hydroxyacyl-CoA dehydrogenase NAD-binding domain-containing protein [Vitreoscilla filiformis]
MVSLNASNVSLDATTPVAVIGAGSMGAGIAQVAAQAGHAVRLFDLQAGAAARALARIADDLAGAVQRGKLTATERDATLARLSVAEQLTDLAGCGLAVEAIVEKLEPKQALFAELEKVLGPQAVLATNTSSISVTAVAQKLAQPQRFIGWHFFNPATRMKLVEIISGVATDPALVAPMQALTRAWGKVPVLAPNAPGFIVNRVARPYYAEGLRLLAERVADVASIDTLLRQAGGFVMGPFELMDLIGVEVNLSVTTSVFEATAFDPRYAPHLIQQELVRSGRFGRKTGHGFYRYEGGKPQGAAVACVAPAPSVPVLRCASDMGLLTPLVQRLAAAGVTLLPDDSLPAETLALGEEDAGTPGGTWITLSDGRTAAQRSAQRAGRPVLLLDLALDFGTTPMVAVAVGGPHPNPSPTRGEGAPTLANPVPGTKPLSPCGRGVGERGSPLAQLAAALAPAGVQLLPLADVAGLVVLRTVACLANEAADVLTWTGTAPTDIDTAMRLGTAYPQGPLAWADAIGPARVATVLTHLQQHYGEVRYRRSPALSHLQHTGGLFHD